jgi:type II secretory pathway predicted ATPase ExeA/septal ring-binding cell division protein DamX
MYLAHFGFSEPPFRITPHTDFFFSGANRGATLEALLYAITHDEGIVKVSGEVGSGKTMLCRVLMERLPKSVETIYLANPSLSRDEILLAIADELGVALDTERSTRLLRALQDALIRLYGEGRRVVVLIDEAHAMPKQTLEEIRLLSNLEANRNKLLQIVLFGQPELDVILNTADMRQLKERITHGFRLEPLVKGDISSYIEFRLRAAGYRGPNPFSTAAVRMIAQASEGLTRRINILSDKALLAAFAIGSHAVTAREVRRAIADSDFYRPRERRTKAALIPAAVAAGLAAGLAIGWWVFQQWPPRDDSPSIPARSAMTSPAQRPVPGAPARSIERSSVGDNPDPLGDIRPSASAAASATASTAVRSPAVSPINEKPVTAPYPASGTLVRQRFAATQQWLHAEPGNHFALQLITVKDSELNRLESFLRKAAELVPADQLHVYSVKINGTQHYRAAYGNYADLAAVRAAMKELPPLFRAQSPYYRSIARMLSQNRQ